MIKEQGYLLFIVAGFAKSVLNVGLTGVRIGGTSIGHLRWQHSGVEDAHIQTIWMESLLECKLPAKGWLYQILPRPV